MKLYDLFKRCIEIKYTKLEQDADVAFERIGTTLYIYFEKSGNLADWKNNLDFPVMCDHFCAHRGFLRVWRAAKEYVTAAICDKTVHHIVTVGYSHGAALALLCHGYIWDVRPDLRQSIEGYGFGCPRVLWGKVPKDRWAAFTVVRNIDDPVTHMPPCILGYRHAGRLIKTGKKGRYRGVDAHRPENILKELQFCSFTDSSRSNE